MDNDSLIPTRFIDGSPVPEGFRSPAYIEQCRAYALLTQEEWKTVHGPAWLENQLEVANIKRAGNCGLMGGDGKKLGDFQEEQARRLYAMPAMEFMRYIPDHALAIHTCIRFGYPVSAAAVDAYREQKSRFPMPTYVREGDQYVHKEQL